MPHALPLDEPSDAMVADATNARLLAAVMTDDDRDITRAMEDGWGAWLGSDWSHNANPATNPVLMAIVTPGKQACLDAFQRWANDVHRWDFDGWPAIHWAIAGRHEDAIVWALKNGATLLDLEDAHDQRPSGARRSALAIAASMGDPDWLRCVIGLGTQPRVNLDDEDDRRLAQESSPVAMLAKKDHWQNVPAMAVLLHELAEQDRAVALGQPRPEGDWEGCLKVLTGLGFHPDARKVPAAKLTCALALHDPAAPALDAYQHATLLAASLGSGQDALDVHQPEGPVRPTVKLFEAAGQRLDIEWRRALLLIGLQEGPEHGCWAMAASQELRQVLSDLNSNANVGDWKSPRQRDTIEALRESFATVGIPATQRPLRGHEEAFVAWLGTDRTNEAVWKERLILADVAAEAALDGHTPEARLRSRL